MSPKRPARWGSVIGPDPRSGGEVDVCVIGSGAGGAPVALALAEAGFNVVVLEKGPAYDARDFVYDEIRSCRRDFFVPSARDEPHVAVRFDGSNPSRTTDGWTANCVGGATVHFSGFTYRLHPIDLRQRSILGKIAGAETTDWPISWEQLEPYYERAEYALGVSGDGSKNPFETRKKPLPLPPLKENGWASLIDRSCRKLGLHSYPTARSILSEPWGGRSPCRRSHFCGSYGCETGAKSSSLVALLPRASATGRCQIRPLSMTFKIETDAQGRASGVRYFDADGQVQRLMAKRVVVACSPVESARLLLMSKSPSHPEGIGNQYGQIGRYLMFVGASLAEASFPRGDPRLAGFDWSEPFVNRSFQDLYTIEKGGKPYRKGGTVNFLLPHGNPIYRAEMIATRGPALLWGSALKDQIRSYYREQRTLEFEVFSETLPIYASQISLDPVVKDKWGLPVARFVRIQHREDQHVADRVLERGIDVLKDLGGRDIRVIRRGGKTPWLQAGGCRFGKDPRSSALNPDCRIHTSENIFVTDGSFMPTSGGVPNTLTIQANAFRVADRIIALARESTQ